MVRNSQIQCTTESREYKARITPWLRSWLHIDCIVICTRSWLRIDWMGILWSSEGPLHVVVVPRVDAPAALSWTEWPSGCVLSSVVAKTTSNHFISFLFGCVTRALVEGQWRWLVAFGPLASSKEHRTNDTKMGADVAGLLHVRACLDETQKKFAIESY